MPFFLLTGIALLIVAVLAVRAFVGADPAKLSRFAGWFALGLGAAAAATLLVLLIISERLGPALALISVLAPVILRGRAAWRRRYGSAAPGGGKVTEVETQYLRMRLDHDSGAMTGTVRQGPFAGRRLDELSEPELFELWRQCRIGEEASTRLMESYLDRLDPDWRSKAQTTSGADGAPRGSGGDAMTREEALAVLGLGAGATEAEIKRAHRELMMKLHPDHGGSDYLAAKINRAKEILLQR